MGKLIVGCLALALGIQAQAKLPRVIAVANDLGRSPEVTFEPVYRESIHRGKTGYVFGSGFGTAGNTSVTVGGLKAQVVTATGDRIQVRFLQHLPAGLATLTVSVDGDVSQAIEVTVSAADPGPEKFGRRIRVSMPHFSVRPLNPPLGLDPSSSSLTTPATSPSGIVYTCDPNIDAASAGTCSFLNTTIAGLYSSAFTNANANIYIKLGTTGAGESDWVFDEISYTSYRNALIASAAGANDMTAIMDSVPTVNPYGGDRVGLVTSLERALGFTIPGKAGLEADGETACTLGNAGCYDGVITISNTLPLYFRAGPISGSQYDFFTIAEHETDEILGTASCLFCSGGTVLPPDYFRYHSNGTRSFAVGANDACSTSDSTNACFSIDGVHMLQQYNNVDNGDDAGDWVQNCAVPLVQNDSICAGTAGVDISPAAEILVLDVVGYTRVGASGSGSVTGVTSSTGSGTYGIGASISIQIAFNEAVIVNGVPQLALNSGASAGYTSGSGTSTLTFLYVVGAGQSSSLLEYTSTGALTLNGGSIKGTGGNGVNLTLAAPGAAGSLSHGVSIVINTAPVNVTFQTNPTGLQFSVDGGAAQAAPQTLVLTQGSHTIAVAAIQSGAVGTQFVFTNWSDSGAASHSITVGVTGATLTASFKIQYLLTIAASPSAGGNVTPASGFFYDSGAVVPVTAAANAGYAFTGWSGPAASPASASTTVTMAAPVTTTANFSPSGVLLSAVSVSPAAGSGVSQTFTFTFQDPNGYADLTILNVLTSTFLDGQSACYIAFLPSGANAGTVYLVDDAGDAGGPFSGALPINGSSGGSIGNSQCTINASGSSVSASGDTLTLNLTMSFPASWAGNKAFYMAARTATQNSGWQALGTWDVSGSLTGPEVGTTTPARSVSMGQTYTFTFTDTAGYADLFVLDVLTGSFLDGTGACYFAYVPTSVANGYLYLVDDAGDGGYAPGSPIALSSGATLQNSQCALSTAGSSASGSGNTLTLNLPIAFKPAFAGNQVFFEAARNKSTGNSGWQAAGSVTVP